MLNDLAATGARPLALLDCVVAGDRRTVEDVLDGLRTGAELYRVLYPPTNALQNNELSKVALNVPAEPHYLAATLARPEGPLAVSLYVAVDRSTAFPETKDRVAVLLDVVEDKPMEAKMVTVDATKMAKDIATTGRVAL